MPVHRHHHTIHGQAQLPCRGLDDPDIGLMGDEPVHVFLAHAVGLQGLLGDSHQRAHRNLEDLVAAHVGESAAIPNAAASFGCAPVDVEQ